MSLLIPTALGHGRYVREFFMALLSSAVIGFTLFYLLPAEGWFDRYGITPRPDQQFYLDMIQAVWTHDTFAIDFGYRAGLVYFPSFHTVIPILCLFTLRAILPILICFVPLVVLIVLSTMTTGSHYPCDIYAGVAVALVSQIIAAKVERFVA